MTSSLDPSSLLTGSDKAPFRFAVDGLDVGRFRVHAFTGREALSSPYEFDLTVTIDGGADTEIERVALGRRALLAWGVGKGPRAFYGMIAAVRLAQVHDSHRSVQYHVRFVPRLWLLKRRRRTRIFQKMSVPAIVAAVLKEAGVPARWQLRREYPEREYATQYEESDYRFVTRLLAEAGIYFYFPEGPEVAASADEGALMPGETVVFGDDAVAYPPIGDDDPAGVSADPTAGAPPSVGEAPPLFFLPAGNTTIAHLDKVTRFSARTTVRAARAAFGDYDPMRPQARFGSAAAAETPSPPGGYDLEVYDHHGVFLFPKWSHVEEDAPLMLRQKRRRAATAEGESGCPELSAGHRFALQQHPAAHLDRAYVVVSVEHHGQTHPVEGGGPWKVYANSFECAPVEVTYLPPRPRRRSTQVALTATVVGPANEEIYVDAIGQIKVQFHWHREGRLDDKSSCWIRTMHPWSGAGWGAQIIPRVGMEVVVVFEGGDPDKPLVLGCVYNGTHPPPFALPADRTRSGIRTQSSPGGGGYNELSFEDRMGQEQVYVHAQRDLDEVVERNHTLLVRADERIQVHGSRLDIVDHDTVTRVAHDLEEHVAHNRICHVEGDRIDAVRGNSDERVTGALVTRVEGAERRDVLLNADLAYDADLVTRVKGCMTTLVGKPDAKRSWVTHAEGLARLSSLEATEVASEGELTLRVGKSSIRITSDQIEIDAPAITVKGKGAGLSAGDDLRLSSKGNAQLLVDQKIVLKTKGGASLSMQSEVKVDGQQILLNSPDQANDPPPKDPDPPTKIELVDQDGAPLAHQRFLVKLDGGGEVSGMTDKDGKAELALKSSGKITFPEASDAKAG